MLVAAVEKNSEFVRLYSLVGMTEANTAEWHPVGMCSFPGGRGGQEGAVVDNSAGPSPGGGKPHHARALCCGLVRCTRRCNVMLSSASLVPSPGRFAACRTRPKRATRHPTFGTLRQLVAPRRYAVQSRLD